MAEAKHAFVATYGNTVIKAQSFGGVGDELQSRGFLMHKAAPAEGEPHVLEIPHEKSTRKAARLEHRPVEVEVEEPAPPSPEIVSAQLTFSKVMDGGDAAGIRTKACGDIHPDGYVCIIPVYFEVKCCHDTVYEHEGPHEAVNKEGVVIRRWEAILIVKDLDFNAYGPVDEDGEPA